MSEKNPQKKEEWEIIARKNKELAALIKKRDITYHDQSDIEFKNFLADMDQEQEEKRIPCRIHQETGKKVAFLLCGKALVALRCSLLPSLLFSLKNRKQFLGLFHS